MKQFRAFIVKEFIHVLRDSKSIGILIFIPIALVILFGFAITTEVKNVNIGVYDQAKDEVSFKLIERFNANTSFNLVAYLNSIDEVDKYFKEDKIDMVVVFEPNLSQNILHNKRGKIQIIADASNPNVSILSTNYATLIIAAYQMELLETLQMPVVIESVVKMLYNPSQIDAYNFVPGIIGMILTLICALMTAASIVREKEMGTMEVLLVSPVKPIYILISKLLPYFVLSLLDLALILFLSTQLLGVPIVGNLFTLVFVCVLFIMVSLSSGMLISNFAKTQMDALLMAAVVLIVPMLLLSGMIFPISNMPDILQVFSMFIPMTWFVVAIKKIMIEGLDITSVINECLILLLFIIVCLVASMVLKFLLEKEFKQIIRNKFLIGLILLFPIVNMLMMPFAADLDVKNINVSIVDNDMSTYSQRLVNKIGSSNFFTITDVSSSYDMAIKSLENEVADVIFEIEKNFDAKLIREGKSQILIAPKAVEGIKSGLSSAYLQQIVREFNNELRSELIDQNMASLIPRIEVNSLNRYNLFLSYKVFMIPALFVILLTLLCGFLPALNIVGEKEKGTIEQMCLLVMIWLLKA